MFGKPLSALKSKKGFAGAAILVCYGIYGLLAIAGQADTVADNAVPALEFLGTGPGVLIAVLVAVILIVWAANTRESSTLTAEEAETGASVVSAWEDPEFRFTVRNKENFRNETVLLDGFLYTNCTFENVTFVYKGEQPYGLVGYKILGKDTTVRTEGAPLWAYSRLLNILGYIKREIEKGDELRPDPSVVRIEDGQVEILESEDEERERLRVENERLRTAEGAYLKSDDARKQRIRLCKALDYLHGKGVQLRNGDHSPEDMQAWEKRVGDLIEAALPEEEARNFLESDPEEQNRMTLLLNRLKGLMAEILKREANPALAPVELRPGFDVWLWLGERRGIWPWIDEQQ